MSQRWIDHVLPGFAAWRKRRRGRHLQRLSTEEVFTRIHDQDRWGGSESRSGPGSDLATTTEIRRRLPSLIERLAVRRLLDIPCGDYYWMARTDLDLELYIGADIVDTLIEANRRRHAGERVRFSKIDLISTDRLPSVDMVLCRDCLVHLCFADIDRAVANIVASGARYLLATTFCNTRTNIDIVTGQWRPLNLERPPFGFPTPVELIDEKQYDAKDLGKSLGLWELEQLKHVT